MNGLDAPPILSRLDLQDQLSAVNAASRTAAGKRIILEAEIRSTQSIPRLAELHRLWQEAIEQQDGAHHRQRELLELLGSAD